LKVAPRDYREKFSKAYKVLYAGSDGNGATSGMHYLTEILDSA